MALLTLLALSEGTGKDMGPFKVEGGLALWTWIVFIALFFLLKKIPNTWPRWAAAVPAYAIGAVAMFWVVDRIAAFAGP